MSLEWDGKEKRLKVTPEKTQNGIDRDRLLERIDANLENLIKSVDIHVAADSTAFKSLNDRMDKNDVKMGWVNKVIFLGIGGLAVLKFFLK